MTNIKVSQLYVYPAKSMGHISIDASEVDRFGLHNDRRWMLVDNKGVYVTQRKHPRMCLISTSLNHQDQLILKAPDKVSMQVPPAAVENSVYVKVWDDRCMSFDCGEGVAQWLSEFMGIQCRLVYFPDDENRLLDQAYAHAEEYTAFSDGFPILLISQESLDDLNGRLETPVAMTRFRPNLVVSGCDAYAEDSWQNISVGDMVLRIVKPCSRCVIPNINPLTGIKEAEPVKALSQYRRRNNKVYFGQNVVANSTGIIELGMSVEILD